MSQRLPTDPSDLINALKTLKFEADDRYVIRAEIARLNLIVLEKDSNFVKKRDQSIIDFKNFIKKEDDEIFTLYTLSTCDWQWTCPKAILAIKTNKYATSVGYERLILKFWRWLAKYNYDCKLSPAISSENKIINYNVYYIYKN